MSIDIDRLLVETATKSATSENEYGDKQYGATSSSACLYRDITSKERNSGMYETNVEGILWFGADEDVSKGDIYYHPAEGYLQIEKITKAKRLVIDASTQFKRCQVSKQRQVS